MKRYHTRVPVSVLRSRLDEFLAEWLPHVIGTNLSRSKIRQVILAGGVYVNRHRNKTPASPLYGGSVVEVYYDENKFGSHSSDWDRYRIKAEDVIYEDDYLIAVSKPSGIPTQPTLDPMRVNLYDLVIRHVNAGKSTMGLFGDPKEREEEAKGNLTAYVGLHHRLDRDTSGLVLFTKKEAANPGVAALFSEHKIEKTYHALVWKTPTVDSKYAHLKKSDTFDVENYLGKISEKSETSKYGPVASGGDYAKTDFQVIEKFRDVYWLEARPKTGRTHQIRVHCAGLGLPILGDQIYFPPDLAPLMMVPRLMLHAFSLKFLHPITGAKVQIECPLPQEFVSMFHSLKN